MNKVENPIDALQLAGRLFKNEATRLTTRGGTIFENSGVAADNERMAQVYLETSNQIDTDLKELKRKIVIAMNTQFSELSTDELDKIVATYEAQSIF